MPPASWMNRVVFALQLVTEHVIGGDEEPGIAAGAHHGTPSGPRQHIGVVGPVHRVGGALRAREVRRGGTVVQHDLVLGAADIVHREGDGGRRHVHDHVHAVLVEPAASDAGADVGLVLVVGDDDLDRETLVAELGHRLAHAYCAGRSAIVAIRPGLVVQYADLQGRRLRMAEPRQQGRRGSSAGEDASGQGHDLLLRCAC